MDRYNALTRNLVPEPQDGPLAGMKFVAKDLFDIKGLATTAGAKMRLDAVPATRDAEIITRLKNAGAQLIGTANMDEYAYGFATVNAHFGTTKNPYDSTRLAGGSSGGSAAAVAAGLADFSLGSDTNGSIRVPASLCGVYGMRPAMGDLPMEGVFPFVHALDTVGPFARSLGDLKRIYLALKVRNFGVERAKKIAVLGQFFTKNAGPEAQAAVRAVSKHLDAVPLDLREAEAARSAAFLITAAQGGALHLDTLKTRAMDYDPAVRDRLIAGAMLPAAIYQKALDFAERWRAVVADALRRYDVLICAATPVTAPRIDEGTIVINGEAVSARANLGILAQPLSLAGIPVISAPLKTQGLPIGVQFATVPGREGMLFDLLARLEADGVIGFTAPAEVMA